MFNLLAHEIRSRWTGILGWGIGLALFGSMYILLYPSFGEQLADLAEISVYEAMGIDMGSFAGYIASVVVQYIPLILAIYAIIASTGTLAGEEDQGTLELLLATPLKRWEIVTVKAIALAVAIFLIVIIAGIGDAISLAIVKSSTEVDVTSGQLFVTTLNAWPIMFAIAMIGLFLGALMPNRRIAAIILTVIFIGSYFAKSMADLVESLDFIRPLSLFHYFDTQAAVFTEGVQAGDVLVLLLIAAIFFALAVVSFERRNVTVGAWPWQKAQVAS